MAFWDKIVSPILGQAKEIISEFHLSPEDKLKADQAMAELEQKAKAQSDAHEEAILGIYMTDRASARQRQMTIRDWMPGLLASATFIGFVGVLIVLMTHAYPEGSKDILLVLLGAFAACFKDVYGYYFGSSAGSDGKNEIISNLSNLTKGGNE